MSCDPQRLVAIARGAAVSLVLVFPRSVAGPQAIAGSRSELDYLEIDNDRNAWPTVMQQSSKETHQYETLLTPSRPHHLESRSKLMTLLPG